MKSGCGVKGLYAAFGNSDEKFPLFFYSNDKQCTNEKEKKQKNVGVTVLVFVGFFTIKNPKISRFDILFQNITEKLVPETKLSLFCLVQ